jgi:predicted transcriptional regulator
MSITVSNCVSICNSPLNNSMSKNLFSFPKQERFKEHKKILNEKIQYELPNVRMTRTCGFGYGNKLDFTKT